VVAVAPTSDAQDDLAAAHPDIEIEAADAANPSAGGRITEKYRPDVLALIAGARPYSRSSAGRSCRAAERSRSPSRRPRSSPLAGCREGH
jgi:hypothetical protein